MLGVYILNMGGVTVQIKEDRFQLIAYKCDQSSQELESYLRNV